MTVRRAFHLAIAVGLASLPVACGAPESSPPQDEARVPECTSDRECDGLCIDGVCHVDACADETACGPTLVCDLTTCPSACRPPAVEGEVCAWFSDVAAHCRRNRGTHTCGAGLVCPEVQPGLGDEVECLPGG